MRRTIAFLFVASWASWSHGYDYASSCARPARAGRGRVPAAPCDLSRHHYCTTPGTGYPWHAIRRFVRENQGLMRRMYGEERHIAVLKAELENFIEDDEEEEKKTEEFAEDIIKTKMMYSKKHHGDPRAMKVKPHFRPIQTTPDKNKKYDNETLKVKPMSITKNNTRNQVNSTDTGNRTEITNNETLNEDKGISYKTRLESIANVEINNLDPDVITLEAVIKQSIETNSIIPSFPSTKSSAADINALSNDTVIEKDVKTTPEGTNSTDQSTVSVDVGDFMTTESNKEDWKPMSGDTSTLPPTLLFSEHDKTKNVDNTVKKEETVKEEFHPKPVHHQETVRPAVIKLRGANACESKEEMAAPFWANSTRGEVLALLNMYPFEQYIHMETCVHERKQMYCREGCRCEQQYRLHRLLAYDPRNECRGIFADWFKFPACCVCKCYDVPLEFRARSPRILHPQYGADVRRAIYEDVARDWYARSLDEEEDLF